MNNFEIEQCLESFSVIADTREQPTVQFERRCLAMGVPVNRAVLDYGDYTYQYTLPDGTAAYDMDNRICPECVIERKMDLDELAMCFTRDRKRFKEEFERSRSAGARVYLLVENANWEKLLAHRYRSKFTPKAFEASLLAWQARYDLRLVFCQDLTTGALIKEILYRELKERLNNGVFDR